MRARNQHDLLGRTHGMFKDAVDAPGMKGKRPVNPTLAAQRRILCGPGEVA